MSTFQKAAFIWADSLGEEEADRWMLYLVTDFITVNTK